MNAAIAWKKLFTEWPPEMPARGVLVTSFGEQVPFHGFLIQNELLLIQRKTPDSIGTRQVILPFAEIAALKITDVVKTSLLHDAGFEGTLPKI